MKAREENRTEVLQMLAERGEGAGSSGVFRGYLSTLCELTLIQVVRVLR